MALLPRRGPRRHLPGTRTLERPGNGTGPCSRPGPGIAIFGSHDAEQIAAELRRGLERGGCPPHLAHWSAQYGTEELQGTGLHAQGQIPGMWVDWTP